MAKAYVTRALQEAYPLGKGHGPVHHFFRFWQPKLYEPSKREAERIESTRES